MRERLGQVALCQSRGGGGYDFNEEEPGTSRRGGNSVKEFSVHVTPSNPVTSAFLLLGPPRR